LLELGEEAFDPPALLVGELVVRMLELSMAARWDDRLAALLKDEVVQAASVIGLIG
jgi:hypothetical protein